MKNLFTACIFSLSFITVHAQVELDFIQSAGFSLYRNTLTTYPAIHYQPRVNFLEFSNVSSISLDLRLAGGYYEQNDSYSEEHYPTFDAPVTLNYNRGCAATKVSDDNIGYYGGIGWNTQMALYEYFAFGPMAQAGFRFDIDAKSPIDINAGFMYDISGNEANEFMIGVQYVFGMLK